MKALEIKNLNKIYNNNLIALDNVSLNVNQGDFYALLGPNGAGKSTMIGIISSLVNKSSGSVKILGLDIDTHHSEAKKKIGIVGQEVNFNQFETVHNILLHQAGFFGLHYKDVKTNTEFFLKRLNLWDKRNEQGRNLSGGMKRRLLMAKALVHQPPIVILDEPTAGVDVELRQNLWKNVKLLNELGVTIILTTHYLEEAEEMCGRIAILNKGNIVALDSTNNLLNRIQTKKVTFKTDIKININNNDLESLKIVSQLDNEVCVSYEKSKINMEELINLIKKNNVKIIDISTDDGDLEDVFLRLIKN